MLLYLLTPLENTNRPYAYKKPNPKQPRFPHPTEKRERKKERLNKVTRVYNGVILLVFIFMFLKNQTLRCHTFPVLAFIL